jgi:hypothetical protein
LSLLQFTVPQVPINAEIPVPLVDPREAEEREKVDWLVANDRRLLGSFVKDLNMGAGFDDTDYELKSSWMNRY